MLNDCLMLASFAHPIEIGMTPWSLLWMIPLIAIISLIYKATKLRVIIWKKILRETLVLLLTTTGFMYFLAAVFWVIIEIVT